jgi:aminoglycoside 3-N-acetyltransferase
MSDVTQQDIVAGIRSLGVQPGDLVLAHTSLKSFGRVDGGAETVAKALIESVSPSGTIVVPTFNYGTLPYDPTTTPSLTGAVTEAFWRLPGAMRSRHPTHSFAAMGPLAAEIVANHADDQTLGRGSPLAKIQQRDGWVLLIGCDHRASTMIHLAEESMNVPYLGRTRVGLLQQDHEVQEAVVRRPGCSNGFNVVDPWLREMNQIHETTVGAAKLMLIRSGFVVAVASGLLARNPGALLCNASDCERCTWARERIAEHAGRSR